MTNASDKNSPSGSKDAAEQRPESSHNILNKYQVIFVLAQRSSGSVIIEAASVDEARQKARLFDLCDVDDWDVFEDEMSVDTVSLLRGGQDNE